MLFCRYWQAQYWASTIVASDRTCSWYDRPGQAARGTRFTYEPNRQLFRDVTKFLEYNKVGRAALEEKITAARAEVQEDPEKKTLQTLPLFWASADSRTTWCSGILLGQGLRLAPPSACYVNALPRRDIQLQRAWPHIGPSNKRSLRVRLQQETVRPILMHGEFLVVSGGEKWCNRKESSQTSRLPIRLRSACLPLPVPSHYRSKLIHLGTRMQLRLLTTGSKRLSSCSRARGTEQPQYRNIGPLPDAITDDLNIPAQ